jgi:spore coat protein U-like protein
MIRKSLIFFMLLGFLSSTAFAANPETFTVQMTLRQVITIANTAPLEFGTLELIANTYTVNPNAGPHTAGAGAAAAQFTVQGENLAVADVTFVADPINITDGTTLVSVDLTLASATHTFNGAAQTLFVGGIIVLAGTETTGAYTGTAQLQMVYQ